jgi:ABC-type uncharacterized transport system ATPase subunit
MDLNEYNNRLEGVINDLKGGAHADLMVTIANDAIAMIKQRVQETGVNARGGKYKEYTERTKEIRKSKGRQTGFVDFTFTGRMWSSVAVVLDKQQLQEGVAVIRPKNEEESEKMLKNMKMRGRILDLNEKEISFLAENYDKGILQIFRNNGL